MKTHEKPVAPKNQPLDPLHKIPDLAKLGGVSRKSVYRRIHEGRLKALRFGKEFRVTHAEAVRFLTSET